MDEKPPEGFIRNGQKIYALLFVLESPPQQVWEFHVPLDREGNSRPPLDASMRPVDAGKRIVDVQAGDRIIKRGVEFTVKSVRELVVTARPRATAPWTAGD